MYCHKRLDTHHGPYLHIYKETPADQSHAREPTRAWLSPVWRSPV